MDRNIKIGGIVVLVAMLAMQAVTLLAVLPAPRAAQPSVRAAPLPTSALATNFNAINATQVDASILNADTGAITNLTGTTGTITNLTATTITTTNLISQSILFAGSNITITGPTPATSATPVVRVNNLGAANDILVLEKNGTPVAKVSNAGNVSAAQFAVAGTPVFWATPQTLFVAGAAKTFLECKLAASVIGTVIVTPVTTNATPVAAVASLGTAATGDSNLISASISGNAVTLGVWNSALTPAAATTAVPVSYCIYGTTP